MMSRNGLKDAILDGHVSNQSCLNLPFERHFVLNWRSVLSLSLPFYLTITIILLLNSNMMIDICESDSIYHHHKKTTTVNRALVVVFGGCLHAYLRSQMHGKEFVWTSILTIHENGMNYSNNRVRMDCCCCCCWRLFVFTNTWSSLSFSLLFPIALFIVNDEHIFMYHSLLHGSTNSKSLALSFPFIRMVIYPFKHTHT